MTEKIEHKKWVRPQVISLGKFEDIEQNDQIGDEMKKALMTLRDCLCEIRETQDKTEPKG